MVPHYRSKQTHTTIKLTVPPVAPRQAIHWAQALGLWSPDSEGVTTLLIHESMSVSELPPLYHQLANLKRDGEGPAHDDQHRSSFPEKRRSLHREEAATLASLPDSSRKSRSSQFLYSAGLLHLFLWWIKTPKGKCEPIHQHSWPDTELLNGFIDSLFCSTLCVTLAQAVHTRRIKMVLAKRHYFILSLLPLRPVNPEQK